MKSPPLNYGGLFYPLLPKFPGKNFVVIVKDDIFAIRLEKSGQFFV
jgi:hypothetical protein